MRGLLIRSEPLDLILAGKKTWELRGKNTHIRGKIALIRSGSGLIVGICELVDVIGPLTHGQLLLNLKKHRMSVRDAVSGTGYLKTYAWVLSNAHSLFEPIPYQHPQGAIIWVNLDQHPQHEFLKTQ